MARSDSLWPSSLAGASTAPSPVPRIHNPYPLPRPWGSRPWRFVALLSSFTTPGKPETPRPPSSSGNQTPLGPPFSGQHSPHSSWYQTPTGPFSPGHQTPPRQDPSPSQGTQPRLGRPFSSGHRPPGPGPPCHYGTKFHPSSPSPHGTDPPALAPASPRRCRCRPAGGALPPAGAGPGGKMAARLWPCHSKAKGGSGAGAAPRLNEVFSVKWDISGLMSISLRNAQAQLPRYPWVDL